MDALTIPNHAGSVKSTLELAMNHVLETKALCIVSRLSTGEQMICIASDGPDELSGLISDLEIAKCRLLAELQDSATIILAGKEI
ncbi:MAG: hypothetical protein GYB19_18000 [Rhodospirillales bacterium]|nr:hypothetical protein [Rhodospirillales bacterium]